MEFKGTRGKWVKKDQPWYDEESKEYFGHFSIKSEDLKTTITCVDAYTFHNLTYNESEANAQLISCAPEMLEMIKLLVDIMEENDLGQFSAVKRAKELIEKATNI